MSALESSDASPPTGNTPSTFTIHKDMETAKIVIPGLRQQSSGVKHSHTTSDGPTPLTTSKLGNIQPASGGRAPSSNKKPKIDQHSQISTEHPSDSMDTLLARLSEQQVLLESQKTALATGATKSSTIDQVLAPSSVTVSPRHDDVIAEKASEVDAAEMLRLKKELDMAKNKIARQEQELNHSRTVPGTSSDTVPATARSDTNPHVINPQLVFSHPATSMGSVQGRLHNIESHADNSSLPVPSVHQNRGQNIWSNTPGLGFTMGLQSATSNNMQYTAPIWSTDNSRSWLNRPMVSGLTPLAMPQQQSMHHQLQNRNYTGPSSGVSNVSNRFLNDTTSFQGAQGLRRSNTQNSRASSAYGHGRGSGWDSYGGSSAEGSPMTGLSPVSAFAPIGMYPASIGYQPQPIGTPLSPTAAEFTAGNASANPWNSSAPSSPGQTYVSPIEPLNYRRLLDRSVTCNWKYIVDKIVCNNDQQASIFLQQKLKVGTVEQKFEIVEAIVAQAYPLMVNRFGNFLVQRCFEHGTPEQVIAIANSIRGNTLSLSMDAFGCHVVQKAFDAVPEDYKAIMVHELLRRIPETVIHRYACHVWQKLFELRWSDSPPQIMKYVNEALRGMWHEVALGETGSLVVQNIFENCLEEDKRPCINEVLASIDIVAHGQFGNWCIQHVCEHGGPADRSRATDHVLRYATEYSMDQFASKVVEKCLKIGGTEFLDRYLERVCEGRSDRPRIPLIDIASDQYGNYLIQYILTHANAQHREVVASHIRKHMVSLRGSKFGSRVGMLCCNPAYATRPGPGVGPPVTRPYNATLNNLGNVPSNRYAPAYR